jgi:hypothetical protein
MRFGIWFNKVMHEIKYFQKLLIFDPQYGGIFSYLKVRA